MEKNKKKQDRLRLIAKYTSVAFQMAAIIVLGALGGKWLDSYFECGFKWWTLSLTVFSVGIALYFFIKDISK